MTENTNDHGANLALNELLRAIELSKGTDQNLIKDKLNQIKDHADQGDPYAHYILASYNIFGRCPQTFDFYSHYSEVELQPFTELETIAGFGYYIQAINAPDNILQEFQIQALYEMYMLINGRSPFFIDFKLKDRPDLIESHPLNNLFSKKDTLLMMLFELSHSEVYLDVALYLMDQASTENCAGNGAKIIEALNLAIENSICWDLRKEATFKLAELYYYGKFGIPADVQQAKRLWCRIDDDRALARVVNNLLKDDKVDEAKELLTGLKDPKSIVHLFVGYQEIVDFIESLPNISELLNEAFSIDLQFPQIPDIIDVGRFYQDISLEDILLEDQSNQSNDSSKADSDATEDDNPAQVEKRFDDEAQDDQGEESHVVTDTKVLIEEPTSEELEKIEKTQNDIAEDFEMLTDDPVIEDSVVDEVIHADSNFDDDPFGDPDEPDDLSDDISDDFPDND